MSEYLNEISIKANTFIRDSFEEEDAIYQTIASRHVESLLLNKKYYSTNELILPKWVTFPDNSSTFFKISQVTELMKNHGLYLHQTFATTKDTALFQQSTSGIHPFYRDYTIIVALDKILAEASNIMSKTTAELLLGDIEDSTHQIYASKLLARKFMLGKPSPSMVSSQTKLIPFDQSKDSSLQEILKNYEEGMVIVDFWASWCWACRIDMQDAKATKQYLDSWQVGIIYVSGDKEKDLNKWLKASQVEEITAHQYLIRDDFDSPLFKYLNVNFIPRYILFKNGKLVDVMFPRLNDYSLPEVRKVIEAHIKSNS